MKRFCALFACAFFIIAQTLTYIPVKAVGTSVDFGEMLNEYLNVAEMGLALSQGATIDWSNLEFPEELDTDQEKAKYIVNYIGALRYTGIQAIYDWMFNGENDNPYLQNVSAIGLSTTSGIGTEGTQDIRSQLADVLALNNGKHIIQRYNDAIIARWNNYNTNYINDYLSIVNLPPEGDPDIIDVPIDIRDLALKYVSWNPTPIVYPPSTEGDFNPALYKNYSYVFDNDPSVIIPGYTGYVTCRFYQKFSYLITFDSTNNRYSISNNAGSSLKWNRYNYTAQFLYSTYQGQAGYQFSAWNSNIISLPSGTSFASEEAALSAIMTRTRNCDIYYGDSFANCIPIVISGTVIERGFNVTIPDAVIDSGTDDGKIVAHPIYYPDTVKNGGTVSIDLDTLNDIITQKVADGATSITMDDVIDAGAVIDADGTTVLTDADTEVADVSIPITKAGTIDTTINPTFPNLNIIPPLPKLPNINTNDANVGFQGMSVLARIINVTVQSCPEPLIMTFFGVIFGVVILGIIKILHH